MPNAKLSALTRKLLMYTATQFGPHCIKSGSVTPKW